MNKGTVYFKDGHTEEIINIVGLNDNTTQVITFTTSQQKRYGLVKNYADDESLPFYKWIQDSEYNGVLGDYIPIDEIEKIELF